MHSPPFGCEPAALLPRYLPAGQIDPPTLSMVFSPNTSPLAGREGSQLTGTKIGDRLQVRCAALLSCAAGRTLSTARSAVCELLLPAEPALHSPIAATSAPPAGGGGDQRQPAGVPRAGQRRRVVRGAGQGGAAAGPTHRWVGGVGGWIRGEN